VREDTPNRIQIDTREYKETIKPGAFRFCPSFRWLRLPDSEPVHAFKIRIVRRDMFELYCTPLELDKWLRSSEAYTSYKSKSIGEV
jgi:hypothetical protein